MKERRSKHCHFHPHFFSELNNALNLVTSILWASQCNRASFCRTYVCVDVCLYPYICVPLHLWVDAVWSGGKSSSSHGVRYCEKTNLRTGHLKLVIWGKAYPCWLPDSANKNTWCSVKFEFQINNEFSFFSIYMYNVLFGTHIINNYLLFIYNSDLAGHYVFNLATLLVVVW